MPSEVPDLAAEERGKRPVVAVCPLVSLVVMEGVAVVAVRSCDWVVASFAVDTHQAPVVGSRPSGSGSRTLT